MCRAAHVGSIKRRHGATPIRFAMPEYKLAATTEAEPAFQSSPEGVALDQNYNEAYRLPAGNEIGAATGIEFTNPGRGNGHDHGHGHGHGHWRKAKAAHHGGRGHHHGHGGRNNLGFLAVAEPTRRGGGAAAVVKTGR